MMGNYSCGILGTAGGRFVPSASGLHYLSRSGRMPECSDRTGQIWFLPCKRLFKKHNLSCSPAWYRPTLVAHKQKLSVGLSGLVCWWISRFLHVCAAGKQANVNVSLFTLCKGEYLPQRLDVCWTHLFTYLLLAVLIQFVQALFQNQLTCFYLFMNLQIDADFNWVDFSVNVSVNNINQKKKRLKHVAYVCFFWTLCGLKRIKTKHNLIFWQYKT